MTLDAYKNECAQLLYNIPQGAGGMSDKVLPMLMQVLYELAASVPFEQREPFFDFWWSLPVDDQIKREVLRKSKAGKGTQ
jgi:hypothetical protein